MYTYGHSNLVNSGVYIPDQCVKSSELLDYIDSENRFGVSSDWIDKVLGIKERRFAPTNLMPSDMAATAAKHALDRARLHPSKIDAIIYSGIDRDYQEPATAHVVQDLVGAHNAICFDVTNACHGFMNGMHLMDALISTGQARYGLVVTGEQPSRICQQVMEKLKKCNDKQTFLNQVGGLTVGDAGGAIIMTKKKNPETGFVGFNLQSQGKHNKLCVWAKHGKPQEGHMDMAGIVKAFIKMQSNLYPDTMKKLNWLPQQIKYFVQHQVGKRPFKLHQQFSKVSPSAMMKTYSKYGNIVSATIPINIHEVSESGVTLGDRVFIAGAGSGLSVSQVGLVWDQMT